jgi:hypothetical protein
MIVDVVIPALNENELKYFFGFDGHSKENKRLVRNVLLLSHDNGNLKKNMIKENKRDIIRQKTFGELDMSSIKPRKLLQNMVL